MKKTILKKPIILKMWCIIFNYPINDSMIINTLILKEGVSNRKISRKRIFIDYNKLV